MLIDIHFFLSTLVVPQRGILYLCETQKNAVSICHTCQMPWDDLCCELVYDKKNPRFASR